MSDLITLTVKSKTGLVNEIQVAELIAVDGKPFVSVDEVSALTNSMFHLSGRVDVIERLLRPQPEEGE